MKNAKISIITVVKNGEKYIEKSILSILNQNYKNIEYIVIDGCSHDNTIEILKKYESHIDLWISEMDDGVYDAMNKGISKATGKWIYFLGADDILMPNILDLISKKLIDETAVYYGDVLIQGTNTIYCGTVNKYKILRKNICHQAIFYPIKILKKYKYKNIYKILADYYMNIFLMGKKIKFIRMNMVIAEFNKRGLSSGVDKNFSKSRMLIIRKNFGLIYFFLEKIRNTIGSIIK